MDNPNRTRDHLANERTFLAWIRTILALLGVSVVLLKLRLGLQTGTGTGLWGGLGLGALALALVPLATWSYFRTQRAIERDTFEPNGRIVWVLAALIFLLGAGVLVYLAIAPGGNASVIV